jgi:oligopeptidase B
MVPRCQFPGLSKRYEKNGENPLLLYAYGSAIIYGCLFSTTRFNHFDRGFIYAIESIFAAEKILGRQWHDDGKLLKKKNTFTDFIDCRNMLLCIIILSKTFVCRRWISVRLLMSTSANEAPELYNGILLHKLLVDVMTTMLDDTIPLTTGEYDEWGNPNK